MKIDFHTHGKLAKKLPFSGRYTDWLFGEAKAAGLDAVCLTEHFNTLGFDEVYGYIRDRYDRDGDSFRKDGLRIFPGMEVDIAEGGHTLVIGPMEVILEMNRRLEPNKEKGKFLKMEELSALVAEYPVIFGAAHAFRAGSHIPELAEELLRRFQFLDCNGKDVALRGVEAREEVEALGRRLSLPVVAGSDTHQNLQYGCIYNVFERECRFVSELFDEVKRGAYRIEVASEIELQVESASILKRALKQVYALGGDYTEVLTAPVGEEAC